MSKLTDEIRLNIRRERDNLRRENSELRLELQASRIQAAAEETVWVKLMESAIEELETEMESIRKIQDVLKEALRVQLEIDEIQRKESL